MEKNVDIFSWRNEDFNEYWKLVDLPYEGVADKIASISFDGAVNVFNILIKCENCDQTFPVSTFDSHMCEYSDRETLVYDESLMRFLWDDSSLRKMYSENNKIIQQILDQSCDAVNRSKDTEKSNSQAHHVCSVCHRMYVHASGLVRHMETQHNPNDARLDAIAQMNHSESLIEAIKCLVCGRIFSTLSTCFAHLKSAHIEFGFDESQENFKTNDSMLFEKLKLDQALQCEFCDLLFADTASLFQHKMQHDITTGYECSSCELASRNLKFILHHRNTECPYEMYDKTPKISCPVRFVCNICETTVGSLAQLYEHRHSKKHYQTLYNRHASQQEEHFCEKCGQVFGNDLDALQLHLDTVHSKKGKPQNVSLSTTVRPYLCEVCGKGYTQSSHLYQHLRFHKGIKPFECTKDGCNRKFTIRPDLNDHIRKCHTGERPYKCSDCHKTFLTGSVYYQHRLIHRNERRYGCHTCEKRFHRSDALKNHERIHTGEKPYACNVCAKKFRQKGDRDKHFRSRHQNSLIGLNGTHEENPGEFLKGISQMRPLFKKVNGVDVLTIK